MDRWVKTFHLEYSEDCVTFKSILDVSDGNRVGNLFLSPIYFQTVIKTHYQTLPGVFPRIFTVDKFGN